MSRIALIALVTTLVVTSLSSPASARSNVEINVGIGGVLPVPVTYAHHDNHRGYRGHHHAPRHHQVVHYAPRFIPAPIIVAPRYEPVTYVYSPPPPAFIDAYGRTCRNFQTVVNYSRVTGTACLQPDGSWRTVGY